MCLLQIRWLTEKIYHFELYPWAKMAEQLPLRWMGKIQLHRSFSFKPLFPHDMSIHIPIYYIILFCNRRANRKMICPPLIWSYSVVHQHHHSASARGNSSNTSQNFYNHYKSCILFIWLCKSCVLYMLILSGSYEEGFYMNFILNEQQWNMQY